MISIFSSNWQFWGIPIFVSDKLTPTETALHCDISSHQGLRRKYPPNVSCPFLEEVAHNTNPQQNMMMWCNGRGSQFVCESHLYFEDRHDYGVWTISVPYPALKGFEGHERRHRISNSTSRNGTAQMIGTPNKKCWFICCKDDLPKARHFVVGLPNQSF